MQVLLEDGVAVLGVGVAAACIGLTAVTQDPVKDRAFALCVPLAFAAKTVPLPCVFPLAFALKRCLRLVCFHCLRR